MTDETTRIINLTEATETDSGMYFVTDSLTGTKKVSIETLIDSSLTEEMAAAPASSVGENASDISALQTQMETKAEIDGLYEDMTVGNAEQLIASDYVTDKAPYLFRKTGGSTDVGNREYDTLVGASAVWNQLAGSTDTSVTVQSGHKYLSKISGTFALGSSDGTAITVDGANGDMVVDLTKFFGSATIPDYVYTLEQSTAGSGVAWLRQYFPTLFEYHEYDAGTLKSVENVSAHEFVGFNQFDKSAVTTGKWLNDYNGSITNASGYNLSDYIPVLPNTIYYKTDSGSARSLYYDSDKNPIGTGAWAFSQASQTFTTPNNACYVRCTVADAYLDTFCINLSNSGYRNGEYEPYWKRSYPLDSTWVGRGIYKLGPDGKPYADGDTYPSDGNGEVRYGVVDLGTLDYIKHGRNVFRASVSDIKPASASNIAGNIICSKYVTTTGDSVYSQNMGISMWSTASSVSIYDPSLTDATTAEFKQAMSGVYLIYELATPTTAEYEPFQSPQICDDFGTEEYVTDCLIPVGHETKYPANLRDKVQHLPDLSNLGNGNYIVNQTGTQMSLIPITSIIPAVPTINGTYKLKCTVSGGQATLTWEVDS